MVYTKPYYKLTLDDVNINTHCRRDRLEEISNILEDVKIVERHAAQECCLCFYQSNIVMHSFTEGKCKICEIEFNWPNSDTPDLCKPCAKKHKLCHYCSSEIDYKIKKKQTW